MPAHIIAQGSEVPITYSWWTLISRRMLHATTHCLAPAATADLAKARLRGACHAVSGWEQHVGSRNGILPVYKNNAAPLPYFQFHQSIHQLTKVCRFFLSLHFALLFYRSWRTNLGRSFSILYNFLP